MSEPLIHQYIVLYSELPTGECAAYVPDLMGVRVVGETKAETRKNITAAIKTHIHDLVDSDVHVPSPRITSTDTMSVIAFRHGRGDITIGEA